MIFKNKLALNFGFPNRHGLETKGISVKNKFVNFFADWKFARGNPASNLDTFSSPLKVSSPRRERKLKLSKNHLYIGGAIAILVVFLGLIKLVARGPDNSGSSSNTDIKAPSATQDINREFVFPLRDTLGEEVSKLKYILEKAETRDEIVVKGQKATAIRGRTFLIITLKIKNEHNKTIQVNTRDYIRMSVNGNENEWLAPEVHNDPVEIQAISTKFTRVGFPINTTDKDIVLRVGEINGDKEKIDLTIP